MDALGGSLPSKATKPTAVGSNESPTIESWYGVSFRHLSAWQSAGWGGAKLYAVGFGVGATLFFLAHQLPARDARIAPGQLARVEVRAGGETVARLMGGPLGEPDFEGLGVAGVGGLVTVGMLRLRHRSDFGLDLRDVGWGLVACTCVWVLAWAAYSVLAEAGGDAWLGRVVPPWVFTVQFPHRDRLLVSLYIATVFYVAFRAPGLAGRG